MLISRSVFSICLNLILEWQMFHYVKIDQCLTCHKTSFRYGSTVSMPSVSKSISPPVSRSPSGPVVDKICIADWIARPNPIFDFNYVSSLKHFQERRPGWLQMIGLDYGAYQELEYNMLVIKNINYWIEHDNKWILLCYMIY